MEQSYFDNNQTITKQSSVMVTSIFCDPQDSQASSPTLYSSIPLLTDCDYPNLNSDSNSNFNESIFFNYQEIFQEPAKFTLKTLLSDKCDVNLLSMFLSVSNNNNYNVKVDGNDYHDRNQDKSSNHCHLYHGKAESSESNFIYHYLINDRLINEPAIHLDPILHVIPSSNLDSNSTCHSMVDSMFIEIGFCPQHQLNRNEQISIAELSQACTVLNNPYTKMIEASMFDNQNHINSSGAFDLMIPQYMLHRLIRMAKQLTSFTGLRSQDQCTIMKNRLIELFAIRSVLMFDPDKEVWALMDVSMI